MPSPFPGMDPFIEGQRWADFHLHFISALVHELAPEIRPRCEVLVEQRIYLEHDAGSSDHIRLGAAILDDGTVPLRSTDGAGVATVAAPVMVTLPMPEEVRKRYLTVRHHETQDVVTVIEVLSPSNNRAGSDGRREYITKREQVLQSRTSLVELDLDGGVTNSVGQITEPDEPGGVRPAAGRRAAADARHTARRRLRGDRVPRQVAAPAPTRTRGACASPCRWSPYPSAAATRTCR